MDLVPLSDEFVEPVGPKIRVTCRDVSHQGIRIRHRQALTFRTVGLSFPGTELLFITRLKWCRFTCDAWYESGGVFMRTLEHIE